MTNLTKTLLFLIFFYSISGHSQSEIPNIGPDLTSYTAINESLPKISKDSTNAEIIKHVEATIAWMTEEHYKSSYAPSLIYSDTALYLAKKTDSTKYIHDLRTVIGNTMLRIKDTARAKVLFLKSFEEAKVANDSMVLLRFINNLANVYYFTDYKKKAADKYIESIGIAKRLKDTTRLFVIHHNVARIYNEIEDPVNSSFYIKETERYLNDLGNPPHYLSSHIHNQGQMLLLLNKPDEAILKFKETIRICEGTEFVDALIEGYEGYRKALEVKKDYKGIYEVDKLLSLYDDKKEKDVENNIIEAVTAELNVERYKEQIKSKELEKQLLEQKAEQKNGLLFIVFLIIFLLLIILVISYLSSEKRQVLVKDLKLKNSQYLVAKEESEYLAKSKEKFFATISHELRTPLYGVVGISSILLEDKALNDHKEDLKTLKFSANYLLALINDLLQFNKIENKFFTKEESTFNLKDQISIIVSSFEYIRLQHNNEINIQVSEEVPPLLKGNLIRLSQVLMNLVGNACKFTERGVIDVIVNAKAKTDTVVEVEFIIKDTGPGIEASKLSSIFDEFSQVNAIPNSYQGTGLGLPIVKKLLEQAGSEIVVESDLGKGCTFKFTLPLKIEVAQEQEMIAPIIDLKLLNNKRILIVEDNRINQIVTKKILKISNVQCDIAENGDEAIAKVKENTYDLILMDINMPVKNGIDATREIRLFNKKVPIIALTAVEIEEERVLVFESGMNDIIVKPYDLDYFKRTIIKNILSASNSTQKKTA